MDGRGGCCIARYAGGVYDMSKVDRIMLRFRPIAPKPAAGGSVSVGYSPEGSEAFVKNGRGKRKYVRDNNNTNKNKKCNTRKRKASPTTSGGSVSGGETVVTLPLLPETPDRKDSPARASPNSPIWLSFDNSYSHPVDDNPEGYNLGHVAVVPDQTVVMMPRPVRLVGSCVTVESVTDTWIVGDLMGCTDKERMMNLESDTCPGFISDALNQVCWANKAYKEMVGHVDDGEMMVFLVMKDCVSLPVTYPAFTCRVRVVTCVKERSALTMPCDVWKMDGGGFAWRLDVKAALCLGR